MRAVLITLMAISAGGHAMGQTDAGSGQLAEALKQATVDMPIGTSPASFLLGGTGESVPRLTSLREFAAQAARAVDESGKVAKSAAVEVTPAYAIGPGITWDQIRDSYAVRLWSRTTVSVATKEASGTLGSRSALGLQSILWAPAMEQAQLTAYEAQCQAADKQLLAHAEAMARAAQEPGGKLPAMPPETLKAIENCQKNIDGVLTKWNQSMLAMGGGRVFASRGPKPENDRDSSAFWVTAAYGGDFKSRDQIEKDSRMRNGYLLTAHIRENRRFPVTNDAGSEVLARQRLYGVNARVGTAKLALILEYSLADYRAAGSTIQDRKRLAGGIEYRFKDDLYLTVGLAEDSGAPQNKTAVLGKLHWGFGDSAILMK